MATTRKSTSGGKTGGGKSAAPRSGRKKTAGSGGARSNGASRSGKDDGAADAPVDPGAPLPITPKNLASTLTELEAVLANLERPPEPVAIDLVDVLTHAIMSAGVASGFGQEVLRRIEAEFVDRNEFRVTEAFEVERLMQDLDVPDLFERCRTIQQAVNQIYADQNKVSLDHLREASVSDRKSFFQRIPAVSSGIARYLSDYMAWEEIAFSPRSTQRVQQRLGLDPQVKAEQDFIEQVRVLLAPFGHVPLRVGKDRPDHKPLMEPPLSPADLLVRLVPDGKK